MMASWGWGQNITAGGATTFCQGGSVVLTADTGPNYQWKKDGTDIPSANSQTYTVTSGGNYTVVVNGSPYPASVLVNVLQPPSASFSFTPSDQCGTVPVNFTNSSTGSNLSYTWDFNDPNAGSNNSSNATNPSHAFMGVPGNSVQSFTVKLTATNGYCPNSIATQSVSIKQRPGTQLNGPGATTYNGAPYFTKCVTAASADLGFTNTSSTSATNTSYRIIWGDNTSDFTGASFTTPVLHTYNVGAYTLKFIVSGDNGCTDTTNYNVFVGSNPAVGLGNPGNTSICTATSLTFPISNTSTNTPGTVYTVTFNDGTAPIVYNHPAPADVSHMFAITSCGTNSSSYNNSFSASIRASNPCQTSTATVVPIYVSEKPNAAFTTSKDTACLNTAITFTNTGSSGKFAPNCTNGKFVWKISPATGYTISSGTIGNDFGTNDPDLWTTGSVSLGVTFTTIGNYTITLTTGNPNCGLDTETKTICVNAVPTASFSINNTEGCTPVNVTTTNTSTSPNCGTNQYTWSVSYSSGSGCTPNTSSYSFTGGTNASSINPQFQFVNPGTYTISLVTTSPGGCASTAVTRTVTVKAKPNVSAITASSSICQGSSVSPSVTINNCYSSTAATYAWDFTGGVPAASTSASPGAVTYNTDGNFTIALGVTNECGTTNVSKPLTVNPAPNVTVPLDKILCPANSTGAMNFSSSFGGVSYSWTNSNTAIGLAASGNGNINSFNVANSGATPITATINVTPAIGTCTGTPGNFTITVNPKPVIPNQTANTCSNSSFTVTPAHNGTNTIVPSGTTYTWGNPVSNPIGAITGGSAQGTGQNSISQTLTNTTSSSATLTYTVTPTSGTCVGTSFTVTVTVNPQPGISDQTTAICSGSSFSISPTGVPVGTNYTWPAPSMAGVTGLAAGTNQTSITGTLTNTTDVPKIVTYTVTPSSGGCGNGTFTVTVTVNPKPSIGTQTATICSAAGFAVTPTTTIVPTGTTYTWSAPSNANISGLSAGSNQTTIAGTLTNSSNTPQTVNYTITPTSGAGGNCVGTAFTVSVTVNPKPVIPNQTLITCNSTAFAFAVANGGGLIVPANTNYTWPQPVQGSGITGAAPGNNQTSVNGNLVNSTSTAGTAVYTVTPTSGAAGNCVGSNFDLTVTVNPKPVLAIMNDAICSGATFTLAPVDGVPTGATIIPTGTVYSWSAPTTPTGITGFAPGSNQTNVSGTLTNNTNAPKTVVYNVTPKVGTCEGPATAMNITVNPKPVIGNKTLTVCSGTAFSLPLTNAEPTTIIPAGTTYSWNAPNVTGGMTGGIAETNQTSVGGTLTNNTNTAQTATYTITPTSGAGGNCIGASFQLVVTVNPIPNIVAASTGPTSCQSTTGKITLSGLSSGTSYSVSYTLSGTPTTTTIVANSSNEVVITGLAAGTYTNISVTANGCPSNTIASITLSDPNPPATPVPNAIAPVCSGLPLTLSVSSPVTGTYTWTGPSYNQNTATGSVTINNTTTASSGTYLVTLTVAGCTSAAGSVPVTVNQTPASPTTSPITYCQGTTAVPLTANALAGNTLNWYGTNQTGGTANATAPTPSTATNGSTTYYVSQTTTATNCESGRNQIVVTINPTPVAPTATSPVTLCQGSTATALSATANGTNTLKWYDASNTPISTPTPSTATVGTTTYYVSQISSLNCEGPKTQVDVTINETPTAPVATSPVTYCQNATASALTASPTGTNTLKWYTVATGGSGSTTAPTPSTTTAGTVKYYVSQITGLNCESARTMIEVVVNATPAAPAVATVTYCEGNTAVPLTATATGSNTLNWYGTNQTGGTASATAPTPSTVSASTTNYYVSQTTPSSSCEGPRATLAVVVNTTPKLDSANKSNPTNCATATGKIRLYGSLLGNSSYTVSYKKNTVPTTATISAVNGVVTIDNLVAGSYSDFSVSILGCPSLPITGPVILSDPNPPATPTINSIAPICSGNTLTLNASNAAAGATYTWNGPNGFSSAQQNPSIPNATTAAGGTYSVKVTLNSCESSPAMVTVTVDSTPAKPIINSNTPLCFGSTLNLTASTTFTGTLSYAWTGPNSFTSTDQNPSILNATEHASGTYTLNITAAAGNCSPLPATTNVVVRPLLTQATIAGADSVFVCGFLPPANATQSIVANLDAARPYETGKWTIISQPAGANGTFGNSTQASTTFSYDKSGLYKLEWAITNDINCPSTKDTVVLSITDKPAINQSLGTTAVNVCAGNPVTISVPAAQVVGSIRYWQFKRPYTAATWQDTAVTNPSITFSNVQDTFRVRLVVIATDQVHCSGDTAFKDILINVAPPSAPGTTNGEDTVCKGSNSGIIALTGNIGSPIWQSSTDGINFTNIPSATGQTYTYTNITVTTWFRVAVNSGVCSTVFSNATKITVFPPVTIANAGADVELCGNTTYQLNGNSPSSLETGLWTFASGSAIATIDNPTSFNSGLSNMLPNTNYTLTWTLNNGICPASQDMVLIKNFLPLTNKIDTTTVTVCNSVVVTVDGELPIGGNPPYLYQWEFLQGSIWTPISGANGEDYTFTATTTIKLRRKVTAVPCSNTSLEKTIYVQPPLSNNAVSGNTETCINTSPGTLTGSLPLGGDGNFIYQWQVLVSSTWTDIINANQKDYTVPVLTATTKFRRRVTSALCSGNQGNDSPAFEVTVRPDAKAQWSVTKDTACAPFNINNSIVKPTLLPLQNSSYSWYANGILYGNSATINPGYTLNSAGDSVTIKMVAISLYGCKNDSLERKFFTYPPVQTDFTRVDTAGCGPLAVTFTNTTPYLGFFSYTWDFGNGQTSNLIQPGTIVFASNPTYGDTTYKVTLTASSQCETVVKTRTVTVKSKPKSIFTPSKTIGCSPVTVSFTNISKGLGVSYLWDYDDGNVQATSTAVPVTHTFNTGVQDTFRVKLIATNQCGSDTSYYDIVVSPNQVHLDFAVNGNEKQGCKQHTVRFINATSGATNFFWNFGDGNTLSTTKNIDTVAHTYLQAGTFTVTLFATNGCSDTTTTETIEVFNPPSANFDATPVTACIGDTIHFTNQSSTSTSLLWNFRDTYTSTATNPVHAYTTAGNYQVQLKAFYQYNSGLSCVDSTSKLITIVPKLPGLFTVTDTLSNCVPFTATFTNQSLPSSLTTWNFGSSGTGTGNTVTHTFNQVGTYPVTMTALHPSGCTYEATKNIVVRGPAGTWQYDHGNICNATPVRFAVAATGTDSIKYSFGDGTFLTTTSNIVYHTYTQAGPFVPTALLYSSLGNGCTVLLQGTDTIKVDFVKAGYRFVKQENCGSTDISFTDTSRHYLNIASWQWKFGDGNTSNLQNPQHTYTATNTWGIQLITTTISGCSDTTTANVFIKVNNKPVNSIVASLQGCVDQAVNYAAQVISADAIAFNNWSFTNGVNINGNAVNNIYNAPGTYTATLISGTVFGCNDTATHSITINPSPIIQASLDQLICKGQSVQLSATGTASITWGPINGTLSCTNCPNPIATPLNTTQYLATATNSFGCSVRDTVTVTVAQPIHITASVNDTICIGQSSQLAVTGATTYAWTPAATLAQPNTANPVATPTLTTKYQVIGFDNHNCFQDTAYVTVAVGQYPTINLGADKVLATGTKLPLTSSFTNGPITNWSWSPATDLNCSTCPQPIATIKQPVCYAVTASNIYKCAGRDTICIKVFCEGSQVFIPNGFTPDGDGINDILMVRGSGIKTVKSFRIFNRWGQVVFERSNISPNDATQGWDGKINGKAAPPEVYVYTCEVTCDNDVSYTYKGNVAILK